MLSATGTSWRSTPRAASSAVSGFERSEMAHLSGTNLGMLAHKDPHKRPWVSHRVAVGVAVHGQPLDEPIDHLIG
jgi:hypothetical protein